MTGLFFLLLFYALGTAVAHLTGEFIPGSVIGMILFFLALRLRWIDEKKVKAACEFLLSNLALFFIPVGVGLMTSWDLVAEHLWAVVFASLASTVLIIAAVGHSQQWFENRNRKKRKE